MPLIPQLSDTDFTHVVTTSRPVTGWPPQHRPLDRIRGHTVPYRSAQVHDKRDPPNTRNALSRSTSLTTYSSTTLIRLFKPTLKFTWQWPFVAVAQTQSPKFQARNTASSVIIPTAFLLLSERAFQFSCTICPRIPSFYRASVRSHPVLDIIAASNTDRQADKPMWRRLGTENSPSLTPARVQRTFRVGNKTFQPSGLVHTLAFTTHKYISVSTATGLCAIVLCGSAMQCEC